MLVYYFRRRKIILHLILIIEEGKDRTFLPVLKQVGERQTAQECGR